MSRRAVWFILLVLSVLLPPAVAATTFERSYEATSTYAYGTSHAGGAFCSGGQDTLADTGGCVAYHVPGVYDFRGRTVMVEIQDILFGRDTWAVVVIDLDGNGSVDCDAADVCLQGEGIVVTSIPADAAGRYVRVFPATVHTAGFAGVPDAFASSGEILVSFS